MQDGQATEHAKRVLRQGDEGRRVWVAGVALFRPFFAGLRHTGETGRNKTHQEAVGSLETAEPHARAPGRPTSLLPQRWHRLPSEGRRRGPETPGLELESRVYTCVSATQPGSALHGELTVDKSSTIHPPGRPGHVQQHPGSSFPHRPHYPYQSMSL